MEKIKIITKRRTLKKSSCIGTGIKRLLFISKLKMIGHFTDDESVLEFINSNDLDRLAPMGTSCPDHFLRTKICPLVLNLTADEDVKQCSSN